MSKISWYWHRLRVMSPGEIALHTRKKLRQFVDARRERDWAEFKLESSGAFPRLPPPQDAPPALRDALVKDVEAILAGRWTAFGHLELKVDDPPNWHCDHLAGRDFATTSSSFKLDHRSLPDGADIKLIWELSRWSQLVRLAMAAHVLSDERAAEKCIVWLEDWVKRNPPFRGWNWTSALEAAMRLIQFAWIDALLCDRAEAWGFDAELVTLRHEILPPHCWHVWRHKSFGSSANNHLLGELAGCIVAAARWPALANWGAPLDELQSRWEREVLAQFAGDGGNREQALHYQLFAWEFCWQARAALVGAGRRISAPVDERLRRAAAFASALTGPEEPWDYGDSDDAFVTPFFARESEAVREWRAWLGESKAGAAFRYWWSGARPDVSTECAEAMEGWRWFPETGIAVVRDGDLTLRWDLSPLGYGATAAHGHLDALHLSVWLDGIAMVVDPGTGAYFADRQLRNWLAGHAAHNGPCIQDSEEPRRLGPFLWSRPHAPPVLAGSGPRRVSGACLGCTRTVELPGNGGGCVVEDALDPAHANAGPLTVRWQFGPGARLAALGPRNFRITREGAVLGIEIGAEWSEVFVVAERSDAASADPGNELAGVVSPAFRKTVWAPYLKLIARPGGGTPGVFRTTLRRAGG